MKRPHIVERYPLKAQTTPRTARPVPKMRKVDLVAWLVRSVGCLGNHVVEGSIDLHLGDLLLHFFACGFCYGLPA